MLGCTWRQHEKKIHEVLVMLLFGFPTHSDVIRIGKCTVAPVAFYYIVHDSLESSNDI